MLIIKFNIYADIISVLKDNSPLRLLTADIIIYILFYPYSDFRVHVNHIGWTVEVTIYLILIYLRQHNLP